MNRDAMINRTEAEWDALQDALGTQPGWKAGRVLSEQDIADLSLIDRCHREDEEAATDAYHRGYQDGLLTGGGRDVAALNNRLDEARSKLATEKAMRKFEHQWGFRDGARACREMLARFVEQGGDAITANSLRLNWNPEWGPDPGPPATPNADVGASSAPRSNARAEHSNLRDEGGEEL